MSSNIPDDNETDSSEDSIDRNDHQVEEEMIQLQNVQRQMLMNQVSRVIHGIRGNSIRNRGLLAELHDSDSNDSNDDSSNESQETNDVTYDQSLPTSHSYLGEMEECSGLTHQEASRCQQLPLLTIDDFLPVPNQTFALRLTEARDVTLMRRVFTTASKTFALLPLRSQRFDVDDDDDDVISNFGCTAEIRWWARNEMVQVVAIARHRFEIVSRHLQGDGTLQASISIVTDRKLPDLNDDVITARSLQSRSGCNDGLNDEQHEFLESRAPQMLLRHQQRSMTSRRAAFSTAWPPWVYRQYDTHYLRVAVFEQIVKWQQQLHPDQCPLDPTEFSFFILARLPLSNDLKLRLLKLQSAQQRLRCLLSILTKWLTLSCSNCSRLIAHRKDVFCMSATGPMAAYVNPGGIVHETLTLHKAHSLYLTGSPSSQDSWFPGYMWTICHCRGCSRHMGWKFTATSSDMKPETFWGLTRSALQSKIEDHHLASSGSGHNRVLII